MLNLEPAWSTLLHDQFHASLAYRLRLGCRTKQTTKTVDALGVDFKERKGLSRGPKIRLQAGGNLLPWKFRAVLRAIRIDSDEHTGAGEEDSCCLRLCRGKRFQPNSS